MNSGKGFHAHLLEQAQHLAMRDAGRPRQANLRRGVSSAYYALGADYDLTSGFTRHEALQFVQRARNAFRAWDRIADQPLTDLYLTLLVTYENLPASA
jgi:hypothetical protein